MKINKKQAVGVIILTALFCLAGLKSIKDGQVKKIESITQNIYDVTKLSKLLSGKTEKFKKNKDYTDSDQDKKVISMKRNKDKSKGNNNYTSFVSEKAIKEEPIKEAKEYSEFKRPTLSDIRNADTRVNANALQGYIEIPELGLSTNVFNYLDYKTNQESALHGVIEGLKNEKVGEGNYVLLGHNLGYKGVLFSDLVRVKKGMQVNLFDGEALNQFVVTDYKIMESVDTSSMNMSKTPKLTLITCDRASATSKRVIVTAEPI